MPVIVSLKPSTRRDKLYTARFRDGTITHFGDPERTSYPFHEDKDRKRLYMLRHLKDLDTKDPRRAGFMSWYILWQYPSVEKSLREYQKWLHSGKKYIPTDMELYDKYRINPSDYTDAMQKLDLPPWIEIDY